MPGLRSAGLPIASAGIESWSTDMDRGKTDETMSLRDLRADFLAGSTESMPLAGLIVWAALGLAALALPARTIGTLALYIMAAILPLAFVIDRARGRRLFAGGDHNPLTRLFLVSIVGIGLTVPLVIVAAQLSRQPDLVVLGMAILAGVIWIPYGWAAGDPVGLRHAIGRAVGAYAAFAFAPVPYRASAVCAVVVLAYCYSLTSMRRPGVAQPA
ncbi:MAG TPA: hypothetical protein VF636_08165 [Sphingomonas sp.]|jgi:hypothetical protein